VLQRDSRGSLRLAARTQTLQVRFPTAGERPLPPAGGARVRLAERMRASGVLPWRRAVLPLVFAAGRCVAVAGAPRVLESGLARAQPAGEEGTAGAARSGIRRFRLEWVDGPRVLAEPFGEPRAG
jgi:hypothetical protein